MVLRTVAILTTLALLTGVLWTIFDGGSQLAKTGVVIVILSIVAAAILTLFGVLLYRLVYGDSDND